MTSVAPAHTAPILIVDDEPDLCTLYELTLLRQGYVVQTANTIAQAWQCLLAQTFAAVITDMRLPDGTGLELIQRLRTQQRTERCIVITAYGSAENAVESLKAGAFDYLTKPVDLKQLRTVVASAACAAPASDPTAWATAPTPLHAATQPPAPAIPGDHATTALQQLVGESEVMRVVRQRIQKVAPSMAPVLLHGESGTGKELAARALHAHSHRGHGPWVAVNCSAIPDNLLEVEFFGARKGSYTGATQDRDGFFQAARGGTLFLDEIGDLPLAMQSKLLRAIQERRIRPVGAPLEEAVDVRLISATHKDLAAEVQAGRFRQDLYYRINVIQIWLPPLRERRDDLPSLCATLVSRIAAESGLPAPALTPALLAQLAQLPLAGNVRELENLLYRAMALGDDGELRIDQPEAAPAQPALDDTRATETDALPPLAAMPSDLQGHLDRQERDILIAALRETGYNRTAAAARLGLTLRQMRYRIARLHIDVPQDPNNTHADHADG